MTYGTEKLDISIFPEEAKRQISEFYLFMVQKYLKQNQRKSSNTSSRLPAEFYKPIKVKQYMEFNREEIYQDA